MSQYHFGSIFHGRVSSGVAAHSPSAEPFSTATSGGGVSHVSQAGKPKTYSLLVLPDPAVLCLGTIGKSNSGVCIKKDCQTNHIGDKQGWTDETLVIIKSTNVAFSEPTLKTNKLSQELKSQFLSENKTLDDWHLLFAYVDELEAPVTIKDLDQRLAEKLAAETFIKTPLVKRKPSSEDDESSYVEVSPFRPTDTNDVVQRINALEDYLTENSKRATSAWDTLQRDLSQAITSNTYISTHLDDMQIGLGIKQFIPEEFDAPSVWSTLANLSKFVSDQEETLRGLAISEAIHRATELVVSEGKNLKSIITSESTNMKQFLTTNFVSGVAFQKFLDNLGVQLTHDRSEGDVSAREGLQKISDRLTLLESRLDSASAQLGGGVLRSQSSNISGTGFNFNTSVGIPLSSPNPGVNLSGPNLSELEDKLSSLEKELFKMKSDKDTSIVKFGALGFKELSDAEAYVLSTEGAMNFGLFVDIYVVCILVTKEIDGESDFLKKLENVTKLNLNSLREATGMAAFSSPVPDLFTKAGGGLYGKNESAFSRYPSYQKWKEAGKETIPEKLTSVKERLLKAVNDYVPTTSPAHAIMTLSVSEPCANLRAFCDFLTQTVESIESYGMPTQKAWNLGTRLGEAYFRSLHKKRSGVSQSFNTKNISRIAAAVWFAVGHTLDSMADFSNLEFKNHSVISGEYIKFMVQNNNKNEVSTFETRFSGLEDKVKAVKKEIETTSKAVTTVGNKLDTLTKDCQRKYVGKEDPKYKKIDERLKAVESKVL